MNRKALRRQVLDSLLLPQEFGFPGLRFPVLGGHPNSWEVLTPKRSFDGREGSYRAWHGHASLELLPGYDSCDEEDEDFDVPFENRAMAAMALLLRVEYSDVLQFVNEAIAIFLKRLDPEALRVARLFSIRRRLFVLQTIYEKGKRCAQLFESFPVLAATIYNASGDTGYQELHTFVEEGLKASDIAHVIDLPKSYKKVPHSVAFVVGRHFNIFKDVVEFMPTHPHEAVFFVRGVTHFLGGFSRSPAKRWLAQNWTRIRDERFLFQLELEHPRRINIDMWVEEFFDFVRAEELYGVRPFNPDMSVTTVMRLVAEWHDRVAHARRLEEEENFDKVLRLPRMPTSTMEGFTFKPLTTRRELDAEGRAMHNCVYSYAERVRDGDCDIVSVRKGADHVATMEVVLGEGELLEVAQLRGKRNTEVPGDVRRACKSWLDLLNLNREGKEDGDG